MEGDDWDYKDRSAKDRGREREGKGSEDGGFRGVREIGGFAESAEAGGIGWASETERGMGDEKFRGFMEAKGPEELGEVEEIGERGALGGSGVSNTQRMLGEESDRDAVRVGQEAVTGGSRRGGGPFWTGGTSETGERPGLMLFPGGSSMNGELLGAKSKRSVKLEWGCSGIVREVRV